MVSQIFVPRRSGERLTNTDHSHFNVDTTLQYSSLPSTRSECRRVMQKREYAGSGASQKKKTMPFLEDGRLVSINNYQAQHNTDGRNA
jgi:hypothetical protein